MEEREASNSEVATAGSVASRPSARLICASIPGSQNCDGFVLALEACTGHLKKNAMKFDAAG